jgi:hypothetical protein
MRGKIQLRVHAMEKTNTALSGGHDFLEICLANSNCCKLTNGKERNKEEVSA